MVNFIVLFLLTTVLFILFFIVTIIIGFFIYYNIFLKDKNNCLNLETILFSFALGCIFIVSYSYFIDAFLTFSFFTIYLPLSILAIIIIFYFSFFIFRNKFESYKAAFDKILSIIKTRKVPIILLSIVISLFGAIYFYYVNWYYSFLSSDPYGWFYNILYLKDYGTLDYYEIKGYPAGIVFYNAATLLLTDDFLVNFFYVKYVNFFLFSISILAFYNLARTVFDKRSYVYLSLIIFIGFSHLIERTLVFIPSVFATTIFFIFLSLFNKNNDTKVLILKGLFLGGIFLFHPLMALFSLICYILFEFYQFLILNFSREKFFLKSDLTFSKLLIFLKTIIFTFFSFVLTVLPFVINQIINNPFQGGFISNYLYFFDFSLDISSILFIKVNPLILLQNFGEIQKWIFEGGNNFLRPITNIPYGREVNDFYSKTISFGILFILIGFFTRIKFLKNYFLIKQKSIPLLRFIKITFFFSLFYFFIVGTLDMFEFSSLQTFSGFLYRFRFRSLELFEGLWGFLFIFGIISTLFTLNLFILKIKTKNKGEIEVNYRKIKKIGLVLILSLSSFFYVSNFHRVYFHSYYPKNELTETFWFMGDYFQESSERKVNNVIIEEFSPPAIYRLLYQNNIKLDRIKFNNSTTYSSLNFTSNTQNYIMYDKTVVNEVFNIQIELNFEILFENSIYIFAIKK